MAARAQVRRFGTNVNQAVRALNATGEAAGLAGPSRRDRRRGRSSGSTTRRRSCRGGCGDRQGDARPRRRRAAAVPVRAGPVQRARRPAPGRGLGRRPRRPGASVGWPAAAATSAGCPTCSSSRSPWLSGHRRKPVWHCAVRTAPSRPAAVGRRVAAGGARHRAPAPGWRRTATTAPAGGWPSATPTTTSTSSSRSPARTARRRGRATTSTGSERPAAPPKTASA